MGAPTGVIFEVPIESGAETAELDTTKRLAPDGSGGTEWVPGGGGGGGSYFDDAITETAEATIPAATTQVLHTITVPAGTNTLIGVWAHYIGALPNGTLVHGRQMFTSYRAVNGVLYPFGHGLSYTSFKYDRLSVTPTTQKAGGTVRVSVDVTNTGTQQGDEVVQLYLQDVVSSVTTYDQVLRGFARIALRPGDTRTVTFDLKPEDMQLLDAQRRWVVEPGAFEVQVGSSSADIRLRQRFDIIQQAAAVGRGGHS